MGLLDYTKSVFIADSEASQRWNAAFGNKVEDRLKLLSQVGAPLSNLSRVMQLDGSGVPTFPDNVAGRAYWQDGWATTDGWTSGSGSPTVSVSGGKLIAVATAGLIEVYKTGMSSSAGKEIRIKLESSANGTVTLLGYVSGAQVSIKGAPVLAGVPTVLDAVVPAGNASLYITRSGCTVGDSIKVDTIYIGSGLYDTPVYDKACCNRATNYGVLPVPAPRGLGLAFNGAQYLQFDNPVIGTTGTVYFKYKRGTIGTEQYIFANDTGSVSGFSLRFNNSNVLRLVIQNGSSYGYGAQVVSDVSLWHDFAVSFSATAIIFYIDGVLSESVSSPQVMAMATTVLSIGQNTAGYNGFLTDFGYDSRIWTQDDVTRYHNGDDAVDSQQKAITNVPHAIKICDSKGNIREPGLPIYADNAAATTGGLVAGEKYRTSTGSLMVVY